MAFVSCALPALGRTMLRSAWLYARGGDFVRRGVSLSESLRGSIERVVLRRLVLSALRLLAGREPEASAVHFQVMNVMVKAVEECTGEPVRSEHARPYIKRQIAGHQCRTGTLLPANRIPSRALRAPEF